MIDSLLAGNASFRRDEYQPHEAYYHTIAVKQKPQVLWIGCSDSRVSEDIITGSRPGTLFVHRNIANIVAFNDVNIAAILDYALLHLKIKDIVVCGHTRCGGITALEAGNVDESYIADWLCIASGALVKTEEMARSRKLSHEEKLELLVRENVKLQIRHLEQIAVVRRLRKKKGTPRLHGWVYRVETGGIDIVVDGSEGKRGISGVKAPAVRRPSTHP
jgi:carbonic anhydrase